jgi:formylglycine-generating enzyme required for sulfatase activity
MQPLMPLFRCVIPAAFLFALPSTNLLHAQDSLPKGVVDTRPAMGPMVKIENGWMVPYRERIPGTDFTFRMIPVPGGTFLMGSPPNEKDRKVDEGPQVLVKVDPMWVGQGEVTKREYSQYEQLYTVFKEIERDRPNNTAYQELDRSRPDVVSAPTEVYDPSIKLMYGEDPTHPAVSMTRYAAKQYTKWLSIVTKTQYRLPAEAEWEYACRANSTSRFSWGEKEDDADIHASFFDNSESLVHPNAREPNEFGLFDMHGNASEWTVNDYSPNGYGVLKDREPIDAIESVQWPTQASRGVVRGGSIESDLKDVRSAARLASHDDDWKMEDPGFPQSPWWFTTDPALTVGFRVFRSATPLSEATITKFWNHTSKDVQENVAARLTSGRGAVGIVDDDVVGKLRRNRRPQ